MRLGWLCAIYTVTVSIANAAFLCLPRALLIGLPPGPVKAISIIELLLNVLETWYTPRITGIPSMPDRMPVFARAFNALDHR